MRSGGTSIGPLDELKKSGVGAAREARATLAALLEARGEEAPELAVAVSAAVATLYGAEIADERKLLDALGDAMATVRRLLDEDRWASDDEVARGLSRSLALLHPPRRSLAMALMGDAGRRDGTEPFLLTSARVKTTEVPVEDERRGEDRHELEIDVGLEGQSRFYTGRTGDLGKGGLFVATEEPLPVGTELSMSFVLPDGYRVRAVGTVAWVRAPRYRPNELPAGMGVRFERLDERDVRAIRHFLEERPPFHYGD